MTPGRRAALAALAATGRGRRLDLAFADAVRRLDDRERRFAHELAFGTVRLRGRLDHLIAHHLRRGMGKLEPILADVLRLGAYQILHMDVPDYAAVSQAVDLAPGRGRGLVNAVLRAVARSGEDSALFPDPETDPSGWLSTWGSHPRWLVDRWLERWSVEDVRELVRFDNTLPPLTLRPLLDAPDVALERLAAVGILGRTIAGSPCVELAAGSDPGLALDALLAIVQDPAASMVVDYVNPQQSEWVADLCAAPGGKALALAARGVYVFAADRSRSRLDLLRESVARTGLGVGVAVAQAQRPPVMSAPVTLLDVPCTGTGTLRRHPDARWRLSPGDPATLAVVQREILEGVAPLVPSGGLLVYSTCTLEPEENQEQVDAFLRLHSDFRLEPTDAVDATHLDARGRLTLLPWKSGWDGAFAARMRRVGG